MSTAAEELGSVTFEEFLAAELVSERRHEYVGGRVYVMSGGSERHSLATQLISDALRPGAREAGCRTHITDWLLRPGTAGYYPDFFVVRGAAEDEFWETDATLIVEVLSRSTRDHDRREKAVAYSGLPSLQMYLLVDLDVPRIEMARTVNGELRWQAYGSGDVVVTPYGVLVVDDLQRDLDAEAST